MKDIIINLDGIDNCQYRRFVNHTNKENIVFGAGHSVKDAFDDAVEQLPEEIQTPTYENWSKDKIGLIASYELSFEIDWNGLSEDNEDCYIYVSIAYD